MTSKASIGVSIAMTTYNAGPWLAEQLASFTRQTRLPDELVVCDDGSTDGTIEALHAFAEAAPFEVRIECNPETLTTTRNFEKSVSLCRGELIFLADQDDVWRPHKIETLAAELQAHPDAGAVFSNGRVVDENCEPLGYDLWDSLWFHTRERALVRAGRGAEVFVRHVVAAGTTLAFRSRYREVYLPFPDLHDCHDAWITFSIAGVADVRIVEENLIDYRLHGANQFGLQRFTLREQLEKAREQLEIGAFRHNITFFTTARERFRAVAERGFAPRQSVVELTEGKIRHAEVRDRMSPHFFTRLPAIAHEVFSRGYWRFGYGAKSLAQDLFLR
ncbi:MAG: glycosyltransferase, partial [Deltaproteobacteria bacterium]|nr:glycosyltransferase [Deltaproteobacteria bacterium]